MTVARQEALAALMDLIAVNPLAVACPLCNATAYHECGMTIVGNSDNVGTIDDATHATIRSDRARAALAINLNVLLGA